MERKTNRKKGNKLTLLVESRTRQPTLDGNVQLLLLEECSFFTHTHKHGGAAKRERSKGKISFFVFKLFPLNTFVVYRIDKKRNRISHGDKHTPVIFLLRFCFFPLSINFFSRKKETNKKKKRFPHWTLINRIWWWHWTWIPFPKRTGKLDLMI